MDIREIPQTTAWMTVMPALRPEPEEYIRGWCDCESDCLYHQDDSMREWIKDCPDHGQGRISMRAIAARDPEIMAHLDRVNHILEKYFLLLQALPYKQQYPVGPGGFPLLQTTPVQQPGMISGGSLNPLPPGLGQTVVPPQLATLTATSVNAGSKKLTRGRQDAR